MSHLITVDQAGLITHGAFLSSIALLSMHFSEFILGISALCSMAGVTLQFWIAWQNYKSNKSK